MLGRRTCKQEHEKLLETLSMNGNPQARTRARVRARACVCVCVRACTCACACACVCVCHHLIAKRNLSPFYFSPSFLFPFNRRRTGADLPILSNEAMASQWMHLRTLKCAPACTAFPACLSGMTKQSEIGINLRTAVKVRLP